MIFNLSAKGKLSENYKKNISTYTNDFVSDFYQNKKPRKFSA